MTRVSSATWRRLDVPGTDSCSLLRTEHGWALAGLAEFAHPRGWACVSYRVDCAPNWATRAAEIHGTVGDMHFAYQIQRTSPWTVNGERCPGVDDLVDIDFGFTPATNLIPMRRLALPPGQPVAMSVAWFDLGERCLTSLPQHYTRRSPSTIWYESPTANYEGMLELGESGFVASYPGLWALERES
ncbi:MAG: putative glycolipid-binding domain-containing protein [Rhodospirillaceae bacterium]